MREEWPYNEEQRNELPLPDQKLAWEKMQLRLDKEEMKRRFIPFWWRYAALGLLLLGLAIATWMLVHSPGKSEDERESEQAANKIPSKTPQKISTAKSNELKSDIKLQPEEIIITGDELSKKETVKTTVAINTHQPSNDKNNFADKKNTKQPTTNSEAVDLKPTKQKTEQSNIAIKQLAEDSVITSGEKKTDTAAIDPTTTTATDSTTKKNAKDRRIVFHAGVGLQKSLAVGNQQSSAYNYQNQNNILTDHLPSLFVRVQKDFWFLQGEAHFNVPQPVKNFSFSQATSYNAGNLTKNTERLIINKLYYHQFPVSVNHFVLPYLSFGAGLSYNVLAGAVAENENITTNLQTGEIITTRKRVPIPGYKDSFLFRTTTGLVLQTDYHWRRFSFGLRYINSLQPYIKYTTPDGNIMEEKNHILQATLRMNLLGNR